MPAQPDEQDTATRCTHCRRPLYDTEIGRWACRPCEDRAAKRLRAMPDLYHDLGLILIPGRTGGNSGRVTTSRTAPIPAAIHPLNLRGPGGLITSLQDVEDSWRRARGSRIPEHASITEKALASILEYLGINLAWACESYEEIADDLDTIGTAYWQAKNALSGKPPRLIRVYCRLLYDDGQECGAELMVDINRESVKCGECGTRWGHEEWYALYEATRPIAA